MISLTEHPILKSEQQGGLRLAFEFKDGMLVAILRNPKKTEQIIDFGIIANTIFDTPECTVRVDGKKELQDIPEEKMRALLPFPLSLKDRKLPPLKAIKKHHNRIICHLLSQTNE